jgi:hypothetical protein
MPGRLSDTAAEASQSFQIIDMRHAAPGFGFSWGRHGPETVVVRHGTHPIFAYSDAQV